MLRKTWLSVSWAGATKVGVCEGYFFFILFFFGSLHSRAIPFFLFHLSSLILLFPSFSCNPLLPVSPFLSSSSSLSFSLSFILFIWGGHQYSISLAIHPHTIHQIILPQEKHTDQGFYFLEPGQSQQSSITRCDIFTLYVWSVSQLPVEQFYEARQTLSDKKPPTYVCIYIYFYF